MNGKFEFNPANIVIADIEDIVPNDWNPKDATEEEMANIKRSLALNGYAQPILVREIDGGYEIIDGFHRYQAAKELGYDKLYVYNAGVVSDQDAKAMTIWMQTQVEFQEIELAPLVVELNSLNIELPYSEKQLEEFTNLAQFDFNEAYKETDPTEPLDEKMKTLNIKMTPDQFDVVDNAIKTVTEGDNVSEGRALELLCASGLAGYPFDGTGDLDTES